MKHKILTEPRIKQLLQYSFFVFLHKHVVKSYTGHLCHVLLLGLRKICFMESKENINPKNLAYLGLCWIKLEYRLGNIMLSTNKNKFTSIYPY